jgi:hypothetical protein
MVTLTSTEAQILEARLKLYGRTLADLEGKSHNTGLLARNEAGRAVHFGHPDGGADVPGEVRVVKDIAEMKRLGGVPDYHYTKEKLGDSHIDYPPPPPQAALAAAKQHAGDVCRLQDALDPTTLADVERASKAYLTGNSERVKAWEPIINALAYPLQGTVIDAGDVVVTPGNPLVINGPGPVAYNAKSITVEPGGQILVNTEVTFNVGVFNILS